MEFFKKKNVDKNVNAKTIDKQRRKTLIYP